MDSTHAPRTETADVVVIGGGPSGASAATRLAQAGLDVVVIEKKTYPRAKTCGDGLTPRSVKALLDLDMAEELSRWHLVKGLRAYGGGRMLELEWPEHPVFPSYGAVVTRAELDMAIADRAKAAGARFFEQTEATDPVLRDGVIRGVLCKPKQGDPFRIDTGWVVVADGSLSRFGRGLGNERDRRFPLGMAIRGYFDSPRDKDGFIESHLDIRDAEGRALPGYGWVFPEADGTVNVGIGLLSTFKDWKGVNTSYLMEAFAQQTAESWQFDPDAGRDVRGGKLPMGLSVRPRVGPNWITVGDAGGSINPFNGEGIAYAMETAELGTDVLIGAVRTGNGAHLLRYPQILDEKYADYYRAARAFVRLIGEPRIMKVLANVGMRSAPLMRFVLQVMANLLSPELRGAQDRTYRMLEKVVLVGPEP
jgi:geranylgeranyl reductase family protein